MSNVQIECYRCLSMTLPASQAMVPHKAAMSK